MVSNLILPILLVTVIYGMLITLLVGFFRLAKVPMQSAIAFGFLAFGLLTGIAAAWIWPLDFSVFVNLYAVLLGDWLYSFSTRYLGDWWLLGLPQVYVLSGVALYGLGGLAFQLQHNRRNLARKEK